VTHAVVQRLARAALSSRGLLCDAAPLVMGNITLLPHQAAAVRWLVPRLARFGGALLADPPGLGKTYVALAAAAARGAQPLVIAPAALRARWHFAARETGIGIRFVSTERLSAPAPLREEAAEFVIIDEAHHVRTRNTRRHQRAATLCASATVLLLTATPVQNHPRDLEHITRLFHLPATRQSAAWLRRRLTLRRSLDQVQAAFPDVRRTFALPLVLPTRTPSLGVQHHALTTQIAQLPALHAHRDDFTDGHPLLQMGLLHALRSSDAALRERIHHRIAATIAIGEAAVAGIEATAQFRKAWQTIDGAVQLAMPSLLAPVHARPSDVRLGHSAREQRRALAAVLPLLDGTGDRHRAVVLRRLARWCREPVVAFTQFSATARALFHHLRNETGIAVLSGESACIVTGQISRDEVLQRLLSPRFRSRHTAVRLLITTDVLSEGLSLAGVGTVVHLDLPWTAARLEQRVGRAARIGAPVEAIRVVALAATLPADASNALHSLLRRKQRHMDRVVSARDAESAVIAVLQSIAGSGARRVAGRTWITLQSPQVCDAFTMAIVRTGADRWLVVHDSRGLRRARASDWNAIAAATPAPGQDGRRAQLRRALAGWLADMELCAVVRHADDDRLLARRTADERLFRTHAGARITFAAAATAQRRAFDSAGNRASGGASGRVGRPDVAVLCGVHVRRT
jgi:superfamily II DNA or RNA helicase